MWIFFSFLAAALETVRDVLGKKSSQKTDEYITAFGIQFFGMLLLIPIILIVGIPEVKPLFWRALVGAAITIPLGNILYMRAVKLSPISSVVPMLAFNPFFTAILAFFFEGRLPGLLGWIGLVVVGVGLYSLRLSQDVLQQGWLAPFSKIKDEPGMMAMLGVALVWSVGANIGKILVSNSSPLFSTFVGLAVGSITLFVILALKVKFKLKPTIGLVKDNLLDLGVLGVGASLSNLAMNMALSQGFTPYVIAIKRTNMVFSSIASKIFFKEKLTKNKILGILLMFSGLVLIILS